MENKFNVLDDLDLGKIVGGISEIAGNENARLLGLVDTLMQSGALCANDTAILKTVKEKLVEAGRSKNYGLSLFGIMELVKGMQDKTQAQALISEMKKLTSLR